ncbi:TetR/AcrR family transcriptional regulator [Actinomadura viridis]|uniref:TetR/AcrR family transcriptional regulator n=1 Tax=Actinomadura viridis TaxID=58110 RepID=UPI00369F9197
MTGGAERPTTGSAGDLTARARIRDAALALFAERGMRGTTIRAVAEAAGVSPGLVQHHFGSKEGLREACDEHVIEALRTIKRQALDGGMDDPGFMGLALRTGLPVQRYLARALVDGSPAAARLFDDAVAAYKDLLERPGPGMNKPSTSDLHAYATAVTGMAFGMIVLHEHLSRALGANTLTLEGYPRLTKALLDVQTDNLISPELLEQTRTALDRLSPSEGSGDA